jgi:hypothetical protein
MSSRPFDFAGGGLAWLRGRDSEWIVPATVLVFFQYLAASVLSAAIGFRGRPPVAEYTVVQLVISMVGGSIIVTPRIWRFWRESEPRPIVRLLRECDVPAVLSYLIGFQLLALQIAALSWLKEMLPAIIPYWADPALARLDHAILGTDAWRLVPEPLVRPFDVIYVCWTPVQMVALSVMLCMPPSAVKARAMLAYFLIWGFMGVCGQYIFSSAGPVFYDQVFGGHRFADLMIRNEAHAPFVLLGVNMLWNTYSSHTDQIGAGISAMPSMHVAMASWIGLSLPSLWPKLRAPAWAFWAAIFIGSFALGWHYFLDGLAGTLGALGCWMITPRFLVRQDLEGRERVGAPTG